MTPQIPQDILLYILTFIDDDLLFKIRLVNKYFYSIIVAIPYRDERYNKRICDSFQKSLRIGGKSLPHKISEIIAPSTKELQFRRILTLSHLKQRDILEQAFTHNLECVFVLIQEEKKKFEEVKAQIQFFVSLCGLDATATQDLSQKLFHHTLQHNIQSLDIVDKDEISYIISNVTDASRTRLSSSVVLSLVGRFVSLFQMEENELLKRRARMLDTIKPFLIKNHNRPHSDILVDRLIITQEMWQEDESELTLIALNWLESLRVLPITCGINMLINHILQQIGNNNYEEQLVRKTEIEQIELLEKLYLLSYDQLGRRKRNIHQCDKYYKIEEELLKLNWSYSDIADVLINIRMNIQKQPFSNVIQAIK